MYGGCDTCKLLGEENCKGCLWDDKEQRNSHWEPSEEFINKTCVSLGVCHENKLKVLDKIKTEIKAMFPPLGIWMYDEGYGNEHAVCEVLVDVLQIIDKYMEEGEE